MGSFRLWERVHPSYAIVALTAGIILGVAISFAVSPFLFSSPIWLIVATILLILSIVNTIPLTILLAIFSGIILGGFRASVDLGDRAFFASLAGHTVEVTGIVSEDPDSSDGGLSLRLHNLSLADTGRLSGSLYVTLSDRGEDISRSDRIALKGKLMAGFGSFSGALFRPTIERIEHPNPPDLALGLRNSFAEQVKEHVEEPEVNLSLGYLLGARRSLPIDLVETLKVVGLTHIIVASGYNLSILVRFSRRIFGRLSRFAALFFSLLLIIGFTAITGFTPSMSRAALVSALSLLVWYYGRKFHPAKLLLLVAAITLLLSPTYVLDLGWLLSFASFAGIMLLAPLITSFFYGDKKPNFVAALVVETISAQLLCFPLLLYFFGSFSLVSIIANILILPTIPIVMALTFATGLTTFLPVSALLGQLSTWLLSYHISVINFFGAQTTFIVSIPAENPFLFLLYLPVFAFAIAIWQRTKYKFINVNIIE